MQGLDLSPILASEVRLLAAKTGMELPDWTLFFRNKRMEPDLRGLVCKKLQVAGFSYSAVAAAIGCDRKTLYNWEADIPPTGWPATWQTYFDDRSNILPAQGIINVAERNLVECLNALGKELLMAARRNPVAFIRECGAMLDRLNQFAGNSQELAGKSHHAKLIDSARNHHPMKTLHTSDLTGEQFNGR